MTFGYHGTTGDVVRLGAGVYLGASLFSSANPSYGTATCNGTSGVSIPFTDAQATDVLALTRKTAGATPCTSPPTYTITAGTGFTMTCGTASCNDVMAFAVQ